MGVMGLQWWRWSMTTGAPPDGIAENELPRSLDFFEAMRTWERPDGPARIGLQIGHYKNSEVPEELENLRGNTGSHSGGVTEVEVNEMVVNEIAAILTKAGVVVDILPTTVPKNYWADVFVSIHADGNDDRRKSGFKIAGPWRDFTGKADALAQSIETAYAEATGLTIDENITRTMRGYYAFSWWRYEHAIHPMTVGLIVELGFLTNASDRDLMANTPEIPAGAIAETLLTHLRGEELL